MTTFVHEALLHRTADGPVRITELTASVARQTRTDVEKVTATVWELVSDGRLDYGADAYVTKAHHSPAEPVSPVSTPTGVHGETGEAQEGRQ